MIANPLSFMPIHACSSFLSSALNNATKECSPFLPSTYSTILSIALVSRCFHSIGLPEGFASGPIKADVHPKASAIPNTRQQRIGLIRLIIVFQVCINVLMSVEGTWHIIHAWLLRQIFYKGKQKFQKL